MVANNIVLLLFLTSFFFLSANQIFLFTGLCFGRITSAKIILTINYILYTTKLTKVFANAFTRPVISKQSK